MIVATSANQIKSCILIVDDDQEICSLLSEYLSAQGFDTLQASSGTELTEQLKSTIPSLILLDVMLPDTTGFKLCSEIRQHSQIPIIMLTARGEEDDRVVGLELGADDYITKPFSPRELVARINALLRRANPSPASAGIYLFGQWRYDTGRYILESADRPAIELSGTEHRILMILLENAQQTVSRDLLFEQALQRKPGLFDRSVDIQLSRLRRKMGDNSHIKTIRGEGYMMTEPVKKLS
jgi:two-component system OmpR family response regulator